MQDETWGALAWWFATILKWVFLTVAGMIVLQIAYFLIGGHRPFWLELLDLIQ